MRTIEARFSKRYSGPIIDAPRFLHSLMLKPILLVEDNPLDQELALIALYRANLGNEVFVVSDGAEAVDFLLRRGTYRFRQPGNPSVVLLDLKLPGLDGFEVLQAVRSHEETSQIPIVVVTGSGRDQDIARSYDHGANAFIIKPIDFTELQRVLGRVASFWAISNVPPLHSHRYVSPDSSEAGHAEECGGD